MLCLHGKEATISTTENGTFWFCNQPKKCPFVCSDEQAHIYDAAIKAFLATNQPIPRCCKGEKTSCRKAEMKVVTDMEKPNFGRPFLCVQKRIIRVNTSSGEINKSSKNPYANMENRAG